ncbi:MAG: hypothetical protein LBK46_05435 [Oscillospiraceae bacterium]|jgi:hypothetical protein|nr:hypothetical protein [Oscillospiraceae bacterium]
MPDFYTFTEVSGRKSRVYRYDGLKFVDIPVKDEPPKQERERTAPVVEKHVGMDRRVNRKRYEPTRPTREDQAARESRDPVPSLPPPIQIHEAASRVTGSKRREQGRSVRHRVVTSSGAVYEQVSRFVDAKRALADEHNAKDDAKSNKSGERPMNRFGIRIPPSHASSKTVWREAIIMESNSSALPESAITPAEYVGAMGPFIDTAGVSFPDIPDVVSSVVEAVDEPIIESIIESAIEADEPVIEVIEAAEPILEQAYETIAEPIAEAIEVVAEQVGEEVIESDAEIAEGVAESVNESTIEPIVEIVEIVIETVDEPIVESTDETVEEVAEPIDEIIEPATEPFDEIVEPAAEPIEDVAESAPQQPVPTKAYTRPVTPDPKAQIVESVLSAMNKGGTPKHSRAPRQTVPPGGKVPYVAPTAASAPAPRPPMYANPERPPRQGRPIPPQNHGSERYPFKPESFGKPDAPKPICSAKNTANPVIPNKGTPFAPARNTVKTPT